MVFGGVPFYYTLLDKTQSLAQNIDRLFFESKNAVLRVEFSELFSSLFNKPEKYLSVIEIFAEKKEGFTREEILCILHLEQIKNALGISGILTSSTTWRSGKVASNSQIDLVIERSDRIINLCEMKFSNDLFVIDKQYEEHLRERKTQFVIETKTRKTAVITMVTTYGVARNKHAGLVASEVVLDDLFG